MTELLLIDLSSLLYPIFHVCGSEPDPDAVSNKTVARVRALASSHPHAAVCCDSGKSFRAEIDPSYKSQRESKPEALFHQMRRTQEILAADGFPVWKAKGYEADDVLAGSVAQALQREDCEVLIASSDKDLLALVGPRVRVKSLTSGDTLGEAEVFAKFGVRPQQMTDYLCLVGDASDNIKGAKGIGPKKAAELLGLYVSLDFLYAAIDDKTAILTPAVAASLAEFRERLPVVRQLVAMRTDCELPFNDIFKERTPADVDGLAMEAESMSSELFPPETHELPQPTEAEPEATDGPAAAMLTTPAGTETNGPVLALEAWTPSSAPFTLQLEPRSMAEAAKLSEWAFKARLYGAYGSPQAILMTVLAGREYGMQAMASLRAFHIIESKPYASADLLRALVIRSGKAKYFRPVKRTAEESTWETQRGEDPPVSLTFTIREGRIAWPKDEAAWLKSGWGRNPADMCSARASSKLARLVYADVVHNLISFEEASEE